MATQAVGLATSFLEDQFMHGYYNTDFSYRLSYAPLVSQSKLFWHYLAMALRGETAPLGYGFDRWFVFLRGAGVAWETLAIPLAVSALAAAASGWLLARWLRRTGIETESEKAPDESQKFCEALG
jgi:hypothetical protein